MIEEKDQVMPNIGDIPPDFALPNQDGQVIRLSDLRGQKVLLFAYPKAGTSGCTKQACGFRDAFPKFQGANAVVLGISPDAPFALKKWQEEERLPYDLLSDTEHETLEAWGAWGERSMYGRNYMGVIRSHWLIDEEGRIAAAEVSISPEKSVQLATELLSA